MGGIQGELEPPEAWWALVAECTTLDVITSWG